ncbi:hypothetical protein AB0N09_13810 [Streptomyces erythrochromogenes]|uniref:hypothetical protein n=1 Tax=Streptomyces erythrochromogenes TaxID=285574 RepID=UPI003433244B
MVDPAGEARAHRPDLAPRTDRAWSDTADASAGPSGPDRAAAAALGGAVVAHGVQQWAFVTFAAAGLTGALAIHLAGRTARKA